jgi:hypothetical protein
MKKQSKSLDKLMQNMQALQESGDGKLSGGFEVIGVAETMQLKAGTDVIVVVAPKNNNKNDAFACSCSGTGNNTNTAWFCSCSSNATLIATDNNGDAIGTLDVTPMLIGQ